MPKKRKLNSKNPKYGNVKTEERDCEKIFVKEVRGVKIYKIYYK
tara:strand:+ start:3682 stop:3813 length:132 start_codon:yes stop_codon:yes gene_type:complete